MRGSLGTPMVVRQLRIKTRAQILRRLIKLTGVDEQSLRGLSNEQLEHRLVFAERRVDRLPAIRTKLASPPSASKTAESRRN